MAKRFFRTRTEDRPDLALLGSISQLDVMGYAFPKLFPIIRVSEKGGTITVASANLTNSKGTKGRANGTALSGTTLTGTDTTYAAARYEGRGMLYENDGAAFDDEKAADEAGALLSQRLAWNKVEDDAFQTVFTSARKSAAVELTNQNVVKILQKKAKSLRAYGKATLVMTTNTWFDFCEIPEIRARFAALGIAGQDIGFILQNPEKVMEGSLFYGGNILLYLTLVVLTKVFASTATNAGGGCGGIFAPSLFLGCLTGFIYGTIINRLSPGADISVQNFALLGMAGLMSGVMFAPLTGVFLIAELTGGYSMFLPLMMVSVMSYLTIKLFQSHSIYSMRLAQKGELMTHHKDQSVLLLMSMDNLIEKEFLKVRPDMDLGQLVNVIARSKRNLFPVVDENDCLVGVVNMESIRNIMFRQELYHRFNVQKLMELPPARLSVKDPMETVMKKFDETGAWNLPVEDEEGRYVGFVSKSKIFNSYRNVLLELSEE